MGQTPRVGIRQLRNTIGSLVNHVNESNETIIVERRNKPLAVLMPYDEWTELHETNRRKA